MKSISTCARCVKTSARTTSRCASVARSSDDARVEFDADAIDRLSPEVRVEVQEYYVVRDTNRRDYHACERRGVVTVVMVATGVGRWPTSPPWPVHGVPAGMRDPWPPSYYAQVPRPGSAGFRKR